MMIDGRGRLGPSRILVLVVVGCVTPFVSRARGQDRPRLGRLEYANPDTIVDLGVGLWAWPIPMDYDGDGDFDLVVSCPDKPSNGTYFFENTGRHDPRSDRAAACVFEPGVKIASGYTNILPSYQEQMRRPGISSESWESAFDGDGGPLVLLPEQVLSNFRTEQDSRVWPLGIAMSDISQAKRLRHRLWKLADLDADGHMDLVVGVESWDDYGWDDGYDESGEWLKGKLHGWVYWVRNTGTLDEPRWSDPIQLRAGEQPIDTFGIPLPI
ncbi:MAG: hypothetical protein R3B96_08280 [Pirellulaceae bacterium]